MSTGHWSDPGENSGTFPLKMAKTLHPTCPPDVGGVGGATSPLPHFPTPHFPTSPLPHTPHPTPYPHRKTFSAYPS
ncbi:hypothetical protein B5D77_04755 [Microcystis sp. MC19]|nr:hypothetical protein B5D77_04755 [Microcystis sp. MC19]